MKRMKKVRYLISALLFVSVDCPASSKLGQLMRMAHVLSQLEGGDYGNIVGDN